VAELTPPAEDSAVTIGPAMPTPSGGGAGDVTLDGSVPSSMAIPTAWSVPASGQAATSIASIKSGSVLGNRYEVIDILGQGGMGAVYKARDRELDRLVALKVIRPELAGQPEILQRFKQELILARKVTHRNVIRIFDLGDADGVKFITMEFIEGQDLKSLLAREGKLAPDQAVKIIQQVCLALEAAHTEGVVHRDLKPQNIMLDQQGRASVMDFGIARSLEFGGMTQTGALIGTPEYMSPEQVRGEHVDERSDLFTLGVIFQEILTGTLPYQAETPMASMFKRTKERAIPVRQLNPAVPQTLSDIVAKCLEIQPQDRFQTAREMYDALEAWKNGAAAPIWIRTLRSARRSLRRRDVKLSAAAVGAVVALLLVAVITYQLKKPSKPAVAHAPVSVLVADFTNSTGDPIFDDTLEPMFNVALEGASFINAYNRGSARRLAAKLPNSTGKLNEQTARLVAVNQGVSAIVTGSLTNRGSGYELSVQAIDTVSGKTIASTHEAASSKDDLLLGVPKLAAPIRKALGDTTPESVQVAAEQGSFTTNNLEAVHQYGVGVEQLFAGNTEEALRSYSKAIALDPNFARAYGGMSAAYANLGKTQDAEKYAKLAMEHVDRMTERERYRVRGFYYFMMGDWQKCVEEYGELVKQYPADNVGQANLSGCFVELRNFPKAVEAARQAVQIAPQGALQRLNLSFNSSYAGDFKTGEQEARTALGLNRSSRAYLALAESQLGQGQLNQATETYHQLEKIDAEGASLAASGLADVATYEGRYADAARILEQGAAADLAAKNPDSAAEKLATVSHIQLLRGETARAVADATKALSTSQTVPVRVLAALTFVESGQISKAQTLAAGLASELQAEPQSYAKIIEGMVALKRGDNRQAIATLTDATKLLDTWISRFELGQAYLEAGLFVESDSEFDRCIRRRGEVLELFMDDTPTYGYLPDVYYYQGRVREGLKSPGFAEPYRTYLSIRGQAGEDPRLAEIRRRISR
jgi:serine/threonine protein kinase/Tfp pilus assembly protein PilF